MMLMDKPAISLRDVSVVLSGGFVALDEVSVDLSAGIIIGFIGPSGAGKTTLIRTLVGRQKISSGSVTVFGLPANSAKLRGQFGYMTQNLSVYTDLTVRENLQYFATMAGQKRLEVKRSVAKVLKEVDMTYHAEHIVSNLSGGQKQRVSLAVALLGSPKLLVLDEPTVGLDPVLREELWDLFTAQVEKGVTIIISSHVMDEADRCDELLLVRDGIVIAQDSPEALCHQTETENVGDAFIKLVEAEA
jgi:ABC-2 type transport system ATP-binding protein